MPAGSPWLYGVALGALTTLAILVLLDPFGRASAEERGFDLSTGDCVDVVAGTGDEAIFESVDCNQAHDAQVTGRVDHVDAGGAYPGAGPVAAWFDEQCRLIDADYLGADVLDTTLGRGVIEPTEGDWNAGIHHGVCYLTTASPDLELTGSVEGEWQAYARGDEVPVNRLKPGDCFDPVEDRQGALSLLSTDMVALVDCDGSFHGMFFGRGRLAFAVSEPLPVQTTMTEASTEACAEQFEQFYNVAAAGSNYRFWRPSASAWTNGDRTVLCAVLSDEPIPGPYSPASYPTLFELPSRTCFDFGPEQSEKSLGIDDRVRPVDCATPHRGQKLGSGQLTTSDDEPYPGTRMTQTRTRAQCERWFGELVGIERSRSRFGNFPYWYPDAEAWADGDRRYSCAVLSDQLVGSLEGVQE